MKSETYRVHAANVEETKVEEMMKSSGETRVDKSMNSATKHRKNFSTNRFSDKSQEDAFQAWSFRFSAQARVAIAAIVVMHGLFTLLSWLVFQDVDVGESSSVSDATAARAEWYRWWYLVPALPFVVMPRAHLNRRMLTAVVEKMGKLSR